MHGERFVYTWSAVRSEDNESFRGDRWKLGERRKKTYYESEEIAALYNVAVDLRFNGSSLTGDARNV